jgi:hypothetical protein
MGNSFHILEYGIRLTKELIDLPLFLDALPGHLLPDVASQQSVGLDLERIKRLMIES